MAVARIALISKGLAWKQIASQLIQMDERWSLDLWVAKFLSQWVALLAQIAWVCLPVAAVRVGPLHRSPPGRLP